MHPEDLAHLVLAVLALGVVLGAEEARAAAGFVPGVGGLRLFHGAEALARVVLQDGLGVAQPLAPLATVRSMA